jgi:osmotically-inducible protein OsmY
MNALSALTTSSALLLMATGVPALAADTDSRIEAAAKNSYNFKNYLKGDSVKVDCSNGVVTLTGTVSEDYHRTLAEDTVSDLPGVKSVVNKITVTGTQPAPASDDWITMKVKSSLAFHKNVSASATEVSTAGGVVTLKGVAPSKAAKALTGEYAKDVDGVKEVRNELTVNEKAHPHETVGEAIDDSSITAQIKTSLLFHKSVRAMATKIITKGGVVSVHGQAKTEAEKEKVTRLAEDIKGVKKVSNHMTVAPS